MVTGWGAQCIARWVQIASIVILLLTILSKAYLFPLVLISDERLEAPEDRPVLLYERDGTEIYFTQTDLLYPDRWEWNDSLDLGVVYDVYPGNEPWTRSATKLSWIQLSAKALGSKSGASADPLDYKFLKFADAAIQKLERGKVEIFAIPEDSSYRQATGVAALGLLAVKLPRKKISDPSLAGQSTGLDRAVRAAAKTLDESGIGGLGIPLIRTAGRLDGVDDASDVASWSTLLDIVDRIANERGFDRIVLGGFGLIPKTKRAKRIAFDEAWKVHRSELAEQATKPSYGAARLALVAMLVIATRQRYSKTQRGIRWWIAVTVATWGLAAGVAAALPTIHSAIGLGFGSLVMLAAFALMAIVGWFSQEVLTFDVQSELKP